MEERESLISRAKGSINWENGEHEDNSGKTRFSVTKGTRNILIAICNIVTNVTMNVSLPIYAGTMDEIGGDVFVLLLITCFFILVLFVLMTIAVRYTIDSTATLRPTSSHKVLFAMGLFTALNGIFVVFASPPNRTPPYLQGILQSMVIPYTVLFRFLILRKGISIIRAICTGVVLVGLFITTEPQIWGLDQGGSGSSGDDQSASSRILWPLCFALGFIPVGLMNVFCEKELKTDEGQSFSFITWSQVYQCICMVLLFWVDFIPGFGMASSPGNFFDRFKAGGTCFFSSDSSCRSLAGKAWLFFFGYCFGNLFQFLLIQYAEGAVYAVIVQALISPTATLFWTVFKYDQDADHFYWGPVFNTTTGFTIGGLCLMVPGVIMYNYFSNKEGRERKITELEIQVDGGY